MDNIDHIAARNYEPSDEDMFMAGHWAVGVQEYHLRIPSAGDYSASDGGISPCITICQNPTMTGSCMMFVAQGLL